MSSLNAVGMGIRAGIKMKNSGEFLKRLSKEAIPGGTYRLFLPTFRVFDEDGQMMYDDILSAVVTGRALDFKVFNTAFMTYKDDWYVMDETGNKTDKVGVDSTARIARIIFEAQCNSEKEAAKEEAKTIAASNGGETNDIALIRKLDRIDEKYHGRDAEDGAARVYPTVSPIVKGLSSQVIVEMLLVPMDSTTNTPQWDKATYVFKECSKKLLQQFITFLDDPNYNDTTRDRGYIELSFTYGSAGQSSQQAGQASTFSGVATQLGLETAFPDSWNRIGKEKVQGIAGGERDCVKAGAVISAHAGYAAGRFTPEDLQAKLRQWVAKNMVILTHIDMADQATKKGAKDLVESGMVDGIAQVKTKLMEVAEENGSSEDEAPTPVAAPSPTTPPVDAQEAIQQAVAPMASETPVAPVETTNPIQDGGAAIRDAIHAPIAEDDDELGDLLG